MKRRRTRRNGRNNRAENAENVKNGVPSFNTACAPGQFMNAYIHIFLCSRTTVIFIFHLSLLNSFAAKKAQRRIEFEDDFFQPVPPKATASDQEKDAFLENLREFQVRQCYI